MHPLVCKSSWCCRYLWGTICREQQLVFYSQFYQLLHLGFYNQHFSPQSLVVAQLRGSHKNLHAS